MPISILRRSLVAALLVGAMFVAAPVLPSAQVPVAPAVGSASVIVTVADYNRALGLQARFAGKVVPGEDHPAGRRGASAPYGDRKLWDFFVSNLQGLKTPNWNAIAPPPVRVETSLGDEGLGVWGVTWDRVMAAWAGGRQ